MGRRRLVVATKPHFLQPFLPGSQHQLSIPKAFFRFFGGQDVKRVVLRRNHRLWPVKVIGRVFKDGWKQFARAHNLQEGGVLLFRHDGNMVFDVTILGPDQSDERHCSSMPIKKVDRKRKNKAVTPDFAQQRDSKKKKKGIPTFEAIAGPKVYIPRDFVSSNGLGGKTCPMILQNQYGQPWDATLKFNKPSVQSYIGKGWGPFCSGNGIEKGAALTFELIKEEAILTLKLTSGSSRRQTSCFDAEAGPSYIKDVKAKKERVDEFSDFQTSRNPHFTVTVRPSTLDRNKLPIPAEFARKTGIDTKLYDVTLKDGGDNLQMQTGRSSDGRFYIGKGWGEFAMKKGLQLGDTFSVELTKKGRDNLIMRFHGHRIQCLQP